MSRLDKELVKRHLVATRRQAENYIKMGQVKVNNQTITTTAKLVSSQDQVTLITEEKYVSRAAFKLSSVAMSLKVDFQNKIVLDVGSSTGGFTDYSLRHGAQQVIAVDVGTNQLHAKLRTDPRVVVREQTDIRDIKKLSTLPDIVLVDVSFISITKILTHIALLVDEHTQIIAMVKPQFENRQDDFKHKGIVKNNRIRREILQDFEDWTKNVFVIIAKSDSGLAGSKGNVERFYLLKKLHQL